jgi:phage terminase large subunit
VRIELPNDWHPRAYQRPLWEALESGVKRAVAVWHRRAGKDVTFWNFLAVASQKRIGTYWHAAPTYAQGRKIIWDGIRGDGKRYLDAFPGWRNPEPDGFVTRRRDDEMKLWLRNGSIIQVVGAEDVSRLVGPNPVGVGLTEYPIQNPEFWEYIRPILMENDGFAAWLYTPRGRNHGYKLYQMAKENPDWFCELLTAADTERISREAMEPVPVMGEQIERERRDGMSDQMIAQEFSCSFDAPLEGSYYGDLITQLEKNEQIGRVPHDPAKPVVTGWDLGVGDVNAIVFAQPVGREVRMIDYYQNHSKGLDWYVKILREKPYVYKEHLAPHDIKVREYASGGRSRYEIAKDLGVQFRIVRKLPLDDGIQACRALIPRCWFNEKTTETLLQAMREYTKAKNPDGTFQNRPVHNWASHPCDAFRTLAVGLRPEKTLSETRKEYEVAIV